MRKPLVIALGVVVGLVAVVCGGTWIYLNVIRDPPPERLTVDAAEPTTTTSSSTAATTATSPATSSVDGTWKVAAGSEAGYRVSEVLNGQKAEAVGRTSGVTGSLTIAGTKTTAATFTVDMATVVSAESRRDGQFRNRIMDVAQHPTSVFVLSSPIDFKAVPDDGVRLAAGATGELTLKGVSKTVTFDVEAKRSGPTLRIAGSIPITFADYGISNPSGGPASVGDTGELEFLLVLAR